jgi:hypothetical protein
VLLDKWFFMDLEDCVNMFLGDAGNHLSSDAAYHPRTPEFSIVLL